MSQGHAGGALRRIVSFALNQPLFILLGTILTYFLNSWTLTKVSPSVVALFFYLQPVIAGFNGWFSLGETPTYRMLLAMTCIFIGVGIGSLKRPAAPTS